MVAISGSGGGGANSMSVSWLSPTNNNDKGIVVREKQDTNNSHSKNTTNLASSLVVSLKVILFFLLMYGTAIVSTFLQVVPLLGTPYQVSTSTVKGRRRTTTVSASTPSSSTVSSPPSTPSLSVSLTPNRTIRQHAHAHHHTFNLSQITTVYHLGQKGSYGRSNNQIVTILHAIDIALDSLLDNNNNNNNNGNNNTKNIHTQPQQVVVAVSNWAFDILKGIFSNDGSTDLEFALELEQVVPTVVLLVHEKRLNALHLSTQGTYDHKITKRSYRRKHQNKTHPYIVQEHTVEHVRHLYLDTKETYFYILKNHHRTRMNMSAKTIKERRLLVLGQLFTTIGVADRNLVLYQGVQEYLNHQEQEQQQMIDNTDCNIDHDHHTTDTNTNTKTRTNTNTNTNTNAKYITIHSRWLEGECERRIGTLLPAKDECWMLPSYIKTILADVDAKRSSNSNITSITGSSRNNYNNNTITQSSRRSTSSIPPMPIVFIGDGQNKEVLTALQNDPELGPAVVVPQTILPPQRWEDMKESLTGWTSTPPQPWSDMMIAIHSDIFIGTRASTFATMVGMSRIAMGKDPATNYIYTEQKQLQPQEEDQPQQLSSFASLSSSSTTTTTMINSIDICEDCLFLCNNSQSHLCGHEVIYS